MAANDVTPVQVFGTNAGIYAGSSIPAGITGSSAKVIVLPLAAVHGKAIAAGLNLVNPTLTESDYDSATDIIQLILAAAYSYTVLNSKAAPANSLRKFDCSYFGYGINNNQFENAKTFVSYPFNLTTFVETTALSDAYNPSSNTLV